MVPEKVKVAGIRTDQKALQVLRDYPASGGASEARGEAGGAVRGRDLDAEGA